MLGALALQLVAITHATVLDMTGAAPRRDATVLVDGARIASVGPSARVAVPRAARVIDGRGKVLIPGLWDMHVHLTFPDGEALLPLYVANGVTGVRDMGDRWSSLRAWRAEIVAGRRLGPRIVAAGPYLEGRPADQPHLVVRTVADARRAVDSLASLGVDFVKIHNVVPASAFFEVARAARARSLPLAGHLALGTTVEQASDSGQRSFEHLFGFRSACTPAESTEFARAHPVHRYLFGTCTSADQRERFRHIARNRSWVTPTLVVQYQYAVLPRRRIPNDSLGHYVSATMRRAMIVSEDMPRTFPEGTDILGRRLFERRIALVGALHRAGIPILAGTDAPARNSIPGFALHDELAYLVQAGLSPMDALRAATTEPARYLGALDSLGTIEAGKLADLVLLDADPLADIRNTRRVAAVLTRGRVVDARERARVLDAVRRHARGGR